MKAIRVVLIWLVLTGCAWGQPIEGGIEKVEDSERLEWIHYEPPPTRWVKCISCDITLASLFNLHIYPTPIPKTGWAVYVGENSGCVSLGDSTGTVESVTIFLKVETNLYPFYESYIIEFDRCSNKFKVYQPQADRKNVTEKFISRKAKNEKD